MKKNQQGFSAIEGLLLLVIVGILGITGWSVWLGRHSKQTIPDTSAIMQSTALQSAKASTTQPTVEKTVYSKIPHDLQAAILAQTQHDVPGCIKNSQIVDINDKPTDQEVTYASNGFAITAIGCNGGSVHLFAKVNDAWSDLSHTQLGFSCSLLKKNKVPVKLLETAFAGQAKSAECYSDDSSGATEAYHG
ncbi:MAG: hypothetical protein JWO35_806 [Candidatus Saccharibacteria bacterium]|nr:hypothetical protein [Candidatus Saccharibacteria bacterium]